MSTLNDLPSSLENGEMPEGNFSIIRIWNRFGLLFLAVIFVVGFGSGYLLRDRSDISANPITSATNASAGLRETSPDISVTLAITATAVSTQPVSSTSPVNFANEAPTPQPTQESTTIQINLPESYTLPVSFGQVGPALLAAGAIDYSRFLQLYADAGQPLTPSQLEILRNGGDIPVVINRENAYFLLNFFWAVGLTNQNRILTEGPMMQNGKEQIGNFASTGGWTLGTKPATELYASAPLITLTAEQQLGVEEVAAAVYRPCCDNPTLFPDCNHGMAMLGLLELMAAQGATTTQMFEAAKYVNAFWFPQQTLEQAILFKISRDQDFAQIDPRELVGLRLSSGSGFQRLHQWLAANKLLPQTPAGGNNCGV